MAKVAVGRSIQLTGLGLLLCAAYVYTLAVDRTWYAVDGVTRLAAESTGLVRWRFAAHVLGLSNGGMRSQSWAFLVFPVLFWSALGLVVVATVWARRSRKHAAPDRALLLLRGRQPAGASQERSLRRLMLVVGFASLAAVAAIATLRSAPAAKALEDAQLTAGNWRMRFDSMREDQRLIMEGHIHGRNSGRFGDVVSIAEASDVIQRNAAEHAQADAADEYARQRCANARDFDRCFYLEQGRSNRPALLDALTKSDVEEHTSNVTAEWRAVLRSYDLSSIVGIALSVLSLVLLAVAAGLAPRAVAVEFRGYDPTNEDPLYPRYTRFGRALFGGAGIAPIVGIACSSSAATSGVSIAIIATMLSVSIGMLAIHRVLIAPLALARLRDPQLAVAGAIANHDRAKLVEIAKRDASATAKQQYIATLQASGSPPDLIARAQAELQQLHEASAQLRGSLLGPALQAARDRLRAASVQQRALRAQSAPTEAFGAVDAAVRTAKAEIAQIAGAAGWSPWPLTASETAPSEAEPLVSAHSIVGAVAFVIVLGGVAVVSRPHDAPKAPYSDSVQQGSPGADDRCNKVLDEYQSALTAAGDSADNLGKIGCASTGPDGTLVPAAQVSSQCRTLWARHFANAQRAVDLNAGARAACPGMDIPSMGSIPSSLRIDPPSLAAGSASPTPDAAAMPATLTLDSVRDLVKSQAASLTSTGAAFADSFTTDAIAFLPHSLMLYVGREQIIDGSREAWGMHGAPSDVDASDVVVGLFPNFAWATAQWKITLADKKTILPVRVTEVVTPSATGLHVIAASLSVPANAGIGEPAPPIAAGTPPARDPDSWLTSPTELARHLRNDAATVIIGSDLREFALGLDESRKLLGGWKNVKLEFVGNVTSNEGAGYRIVAGYARWRGAKPSLFRVLALFVPADDPMGMGPAPWELATAHYSVAVPSPAGAASASAASTPVPAAPPLVAGASATTARAPPSPQSSASTPASASPVSVMLVAANGSTAFEVWENGKKILDGPVGLEVAPGHPRTVTIKARGWKDRTLVVDGKIDRVEVKLELIPSCTTALADPSSAECRAQYCAGHPDDMRCQSE